MGFRGLIDEALDTTGEEEGNRGEDDGMSRGSRPIPVPEVEDQERRSPYRNCHLHRPGRGTPKA